VHVTLPWYHLCIVTCVPSSWKASDLVCRSSWVIALLCHTLVLLDLTMSAWPWTKSWTMHWECRFAKLQEAGLRPDRVTYNTLLKCCMRNRLADQAMHTYREMVQLAIPVSLLPKTCFASAFLKDSGFGGWLLKSGAVPSLPSYPNCTGSLPACCSRHVSMHS